MKYVRRTKRQLKNIDYTYKSIDEEIKLISREDKKKSCREYNQRWADIIKKCSRPVTKSKTKKKTKRKQKTKNKKKQKNKQIKWDYSWEKCYATIEDMKNDVIKVMNLSNEHRLNIIQLLNQKNTFMFHFLAYYVYITVFLKKL